MSNHKEIDCPVCPGPVCVKDGNGPEMVFTLTYTHKHGADVGVYRSREGAESAAYGLADERAEEWDDKEDTARFKAEENHDLAFDIFQEVEGEMAYGEILEIIETELRD
jgi:hypothetical protein